MIQRVLLPLAGLALIGCSGRREPPIHERPAEERGASGASVAAPESDADALAFWGLDLRQHQLWLLEGPDGPLYRVKSKEGEVLADMLDDDALLLEFPELHEMLHGAVDIGY